MAGPASISTSGPCACCGGDPLEFSVQSLDTLPDDFDKDGRCGYKAPNGKVYLHRQWGGGINMEHDHSCGEYSGDRENRRFQVDGQAYWSISDCTEASSSLSLDNDVVPYSHSYPGEQDLAALLPKDIIGEPTAINEGSYLDDGYLRDYHYSKCIGYSRGVNSTVNIHGSFGEIWDNEYTLASLIAKILTSEWSEYVEDPDFSTAAYGSSTSSMDDSTNFRMVRYRLIKVGLIPGATYELSVEILRLIFTPDWESHADDHTLYATQETLGVASAEGILIITDVIVPNDVGFSTRVGKNSLKLIE